MSAAKPGPAGRARNWSWNRLDRPFADALVAASGVERGHLVLDLGAGDGAITMPLAALGARVIAFELHPGRAARLRRTCPAAVKVVVADVRDLRLPKRPFRVVANPPFRGVSAVVTRVTHPASQLVRADLLVPRSVAEAWSPRLVRRGWNPTTEQQLPRSAFTPRPRIDVVHFSIQRRS